MLVNNLAKEEKLRILSKKKIEPGNIEVPIYTKKNLNERKNKRSVKEKRRKNLYEDRNRKGITFLVRRSIVSFNRILT